MKPPHKLRVMFAVTLVLLCLSVAPALSQAPVVVIDPAHGGDDSGVALSRGSFEKDITLVLARKIRKGMTDDTNVTVVLTRDGDVTRSLSERKGIAERGGADLYLSLHVNAGFGNEAKGYEIYVAGYKEPGAEKDGASDDVIIRDMIESRSINDSIRFARLLQKNLRTVFPRQDRGIRTLPVLLLEGMNMPAVVAELGFSTNTDNNKQIMDESVLDALADLLRLSVLEYYSKGL